MNNSKLTIEQFNMYKSKLQAIVDNYDREYELNKDNEDFDRDKLEKEMEKNYYEIQMELLSFDLSNIPSSAWEDFQLLADKEHKVDLSNTHANIDFYYFEYSPEISFKGCKIENIQSINCILNSDNFDLEVINENNNLFLSELFSEEIKEKINSRRLTLEELVSLTEEELNEILAKPFLDHVQYYSRSLIEIIGLEKLLEVSKTSRKDFEDIYQLYSNRFLRFDNPFDEADFQEILQDISPEELKLMLYGIERKRILNDEHNIINPSDYPEHFIKENDDIFMIEKDLSDDLRKRLYERKLTFEDIVNNQELYLNLPSTSFLNFDGNFKTHMFSYIIEALGKEISLKAYRLNPELFDYIIECGLASEFADYFNSTNRITPQELVEDKTKFDDFLESFMELNNKLENGRQLELYKTSLFKLPYNQQRVLDVFGLDNIKKLEAEMKIFTHKSNMWSKDLELFSAFASFFGNYDEYYEHFLNLDISTRDYESFKDMIATCLGAMKKSGVFTDFPNYDWIQGEFRRKHHEIFISPDAPEELRELFYKARIDPEYIYENPESIKYIMDKDPGNTINAKTTMIIPMGKMSGHYLPYSQNFATEYSKKYGNKAYFELCTTYGSLISNIEVDSMKGEINDKELIEIALRNAIYRKIQNNNVSFNRLKNNEKFIKEHPDIFLDLSTFSTIPLEERERIETSCYECSLRFEDIKKHPELIPYLQTKNIEIIFGLNTNKKTTRSRKSHRPGFYDTSIRNDYSEIELLTALGKANFLELCKNYGKCMDNICNKLHESLVFENNQFIRRNNSSLSIDENNQDIDGNNSPLTFEEIKKEIEKIIIKDVFTGKITCTHYDAPEFLLDSYPELFLSPEAPNDLQQAFYNLSENDGYNYKGFSFKLLKEHKEWLPFLEGKALEVAFIRQRTYAANEGKVIKDYFNLFGDKALKLGINRAEIVEQMILDNQVGLMKQWYDKTGGKFIPDFVVMQNFPIEEADKFLLAGSNWSTLMRIKSFSQTPESRDAMLKLAYSFGAFDQDQRGIKKLQELLTGLPRKIESNHERLMNEISRLEEIMKEPEEPGVFGKPRGYEEYFILKEILVEEGFNINNNQDIFSQIYRRNEDGSYSLTINQQSYPKSSQIIRELLEEFPDSPIVTPAKAHQLFGGFELKYDPDFREFLLSYIDLILENNEYTSSVSNVQKQFKEIKAINSNRVLTWDLAVSYTLSNKYVGIETGNERVAEISSIAGYSQEEFNTLQLIYNYGKQRTFSSIPRIEGKTSKKSGNYTYETLRLDDPLAMAIGTLTDCCQELGNCAEVCMEHSMVDQNGRVFIIKDEKGNIIAQSWTWRNGNVICFDNIEIPDKAFTRITKEQPEIGNKGFADEVFQIYKQAAQDLMRADEEAFKALVEEGKITQEQYEDLILGKVTVGIGYNDIAESLKKNATADGGVKRPLPFEEPVKLTRGLYTNDSTVQYILEERTDRQDFEVETLPIHTDTYFEYEDSSFTEKNLLTLEKLEIATKPDARYLDTELAENNDMTKIVSTLAYNYSLNPETTRIVMNPNFAIIYDINNGQMKIGDLLFNKTFNNGQQTIDIEETVVMQIRLALDQIGQDMQINVDSLNEEQLAMYSKAISLTDEIDNGRGVGHAK